MLITDNSKLEKYSSKMRIWQGIPSIERTRGGKLFAAFYSGGTREYLSNFCVLVSSADDGLHWSEPIAAADNGSDSRCFDPCLWIDPTGRLWFCWSVMPDHAVWCSVCDDPDAEPLIWSEPREIGYDVMMNKPTVTSWGEWLFPMAVWKIDILGLPTPHRDRKAFAFSSIDGGASFKPIGGADVPGSVFDEHIITELRNGILMMLVRTSYGIGRSYSYDEGKTWTKGENSGIKGPSSRFCIRRLASGNLIMVNHVNFSGRNNLTAMLSSDDGATWKGSLLLDERQDVSYPDLAESGDGTIYIIYDHDRGGYCHSLRETYSHDRAILMAKITEDDILAGKICSEGSQLQMVVSRLDEFHGEDPFDEERMRDDNELVEQLSRLTSGEQIIDAVCQRFGDGCKGFEPDCRIRLDSLFEQLLQTAEGIDTAERRKLIEDIFALLRTDAAPASSTIVTDTIEYVRKNLSENLTLEDISSKVLSSRYYLCHVFKKTTGITVMQYLLECRITEAKRLLGTTDRSITEISALTGFNNVNYFTKMFKCCAGVSPSQYRKNC